MFIFVKTFDKTITVEVDEFDSIDKLKSLIQEKEGIPCEDQRLVYGGQQLESCLNDYNIKSGNFIKIIILLSC